MLYVLKNIESGVFETYGYADKAEAEKYLSAYNRYYYEYELVEKEIKDSVTYYELTNSVSETGSVVELRHTDFDFVNAYSKQHTGYYGAIGHIAEITLVTTTDGFVFTVLKNNKNIL